MNIGRNDPCYCGSGKKYKKCCLGSKINDSKNTSFTNYNPIEAIKTLALLQLVPENHGKNLRIEKALANIIYANKSNLDSNVSKYNNLNPVQLLQSLNREFPRKYTEDPPENSFTENIMYQNGNNTVFPGVLEGGSQVVQSLLNSINFFSDRFPEKFRTEISKGVLFIFEIHQFICDELKYKRWEFESQTKEELHFNENCNEEQIDLIEFNIRDLKDTGLDLEILKEFTTDVKTFRFNESDPNSNELLYKPFIEVNGTFILTMPSAQVMVINEYILRKAKEHECYEELCDVYKKMVYSEFIKLLHTLRYVITDIGKTNEDIYEAPYINVLQFDNDKFAIVVLLDNTSNNGIGRIQFPQIEIENVIEQIKQVAPDYKIHLIGVPVKISAMSGFIYLPDEIKGVDQRTILTIFDLQGITSLWKCDNLTLWKFAKHKDRAESKIRIMPGYTNLTYFNWYEKNAQSFFHSDEFYDMIAFDYNTQADLIRQVNLSLDLHLVNMIADETHLVKIPVCRKEKYLPIYVPTGPNSNKVYSLLELYDMPIWVTCLAEFFPIGDGFMGAVTYWLTEMYDTFNDQLNLAGELPILIELDFDSRYINKDHNLLAERSLLLYATDIDLRVITIQIPYNFTEVIKSENNNAEKDLMGFILKGIIELVLAETGNIIFDNTELRNYLNVILSNPDQRMIIPINPDTKIKYNNTSTVRNRYLQESDISFIRENLLEWAGIKSLDHIKSKKDKTDLCNQFVTVLIAKYRETVKDYEIIGLLKMLMMRHESLIYYGTYIEESIKSKMICYSKYENVIEEYRKEVKRSVPTMLAYRCLVEFILAEPPTGNSKINNDDLDYLHALMEQIIDFGNLSDVINEGFSEMNMDVLPSGRLGIDHDFFNNELKNFSRSIVDNDISDRLNKNSSIKSSKESNQDKYADKIEEAFKLEWGIGIFEISEICTFLSMYAIYKLERSFIVMSEIDFLNLFEDSPYKIEDIHSFCKYMAHTSRGSLTSPPINSGYRREEIYPWRYNRQVSYLRLPLIELGNEEGERTFIWSPRHLEIASENLLSMFYSGTLKVDPKFKRINSLLAERNRINGDEFREKVFNWLTEYSDLYLVPHEAKISPRGSLKSEENLGDVDILAIDLSTKQILLLELKNTKQAKVTYELKRDIENYLNSLIPKHSKRERWIIENKHLVGDLVNMNVDDFNVYSSIISSSTLPLKYLDKSPMPIFAFSELKSTGVSLFSPNS